MKRRYETVFITRPDLTSTQVEGLMKKFSEIIEQDEGQVHKTEYCGLQSLAYLINKSRKGHYALMHISASGKAVTEMERVMRINEDVIRYLTVQVEEHEKGSSALLKASRYARDFVPGMDGKPEDFSKRRFEKRVEFSEGASSLENLEGPIKELNTVEGESL